MRVFICSRTVLAPKLKPVFPEPQAGAERVKGMHSSSELLPNLGSFSGIYLEDKTHSAFTLHAFECKYVFP